jgi:hypothetical protein
MTRVIVWLIQIVRDNLSAAYKPLCSAAGKAAGDEISDCVSMLLQEAFDGKDDRGADPEWSTV